MLFRSAIDDRCNFASASLGTRVVSLWNQSSDKSTRDRVYADGSVWETRLGIGGRVLKLPPADPNASEIDRYRTARYLYPTPQWSHGSAVLDLLAGHDLRLARAGPGTTPREIGRQRWPGGAPPKVHFVQLPVSTILDTSGGALSTHVLDGIQYAIDQAEPNQSVIVNCSYGTHGGPHDGSSMFERALYELLVFYDGPASRKDNLGKTLHVVLPAGNSHLLRCHASEWLGPGREMKLPWKVLPDDPTDNFVEIWIGDDDDVSITVEPPGGERSPAMLRGEAWTWDLGNDGVRACLVFPWNAAQGEKGAMALLAVAATREGGYAYGPENAASGSTQLKNAQTLQGRYLKLAPHGVWNITICNRKKSDGTPQQCASVHAWVQRGDFAPGRGRETRGYWGRQSYFVDDGSGLVNPRFTLNGIATLQHSRLFVVGAMRHQDHCVSRYSAAGPNRDSGDRCEGPDLVTVADESIHLPGLLLRGTTAGSRVRVSGTSVAAPLVARLLYEHLLAGKTAESFVHSYALDECTHVEPLGEGQPEWAEPFLRGATHRLVPTDDDGALIRRAKAPYAAAGNANEVGSQSPCLARAP